MAVSDQKGNVIRIAVFDLDWTLLRFASGEGLLLQALRREGLLTGRSWARWLFHAFRRAPSGVYQAVLTNKTYLTHLSPRILTESVETAFNDHMRERLDSGLCSEIQRFRNQGYHTLLISGSLQIICDRIQRHLPLDTVIGTRLEMRNGRYTGRILEPYPALWGKVALLKRHLRGRDVNWSESAAFADSAWDIPLLDRFGQAFAVNPDRVLRRESRRRGWHVIERDWDETDPWVRHWSRFYRPR